MKKYLLLALCAFLVQALSAQDRIVKRRGETIEVNITKSTDDAVEYVYPGETVVNEVSKKSLSKIIYSSGRVEVCNTNFALPVINGKEDWKKVVVTYLESDVRGLTRVKEIKATSGWGGSLMSSVGYNDALNKLKKQAAKLGASVILVNGVPNEHAAARGGGVKVVGVCYK